MKTLSGKELAGFVKERQSILARETKKKLLILRDSDSPVIEKYVNLKINYGADIGVAVEDFVAKNSAELEEKLLAANKNPEISGIIIQLPLKDKEKTEELCNKIAPEKDVDGLGENAKFDSATATAINWLLAGYDIDLSGKKIALVGRGKLVGKPLFRMWTNSGFDVSLFHRGDDLSQLRNFDVVVSATGVPGLIKNEMIKSGAVLVDAGTASEAGKLVGDFAAEIRERNDLAALTPKFGGVGPLTVACLFDHVLSA